MSKFVIFFSSLLSSILISSVLIASHVYVRSDGPADGNGRSWETAFKSIDAAILNIQTHPEDTTFWVAAGIYSPILPYAPSGVTGGAAGDNFAVGLLTYDLSNGVKIYGGFKGNEKCLSERPTIKNPLLKVNQKYQSDCIPKKVVDFGLTILDGAGSNSWHVITVGNDIALTGANVALFDLTIQGGYANGPDAGTLDPIFFSLTSLDYAHDSGGGIYARFGSHVDLFNVQFVNNASSGINATISTKGFNVISGGGAISAFDPDTVINLKNSYFTHNNAFAFGVGGGAISIIFEANLNVAECIFSDNVSNRSGGAIRAKEGGDIYVSGSYFSRNVASDLNLIRDEAAGAIDIFQSSLYLKTSTFLNNQSLVGGGAILFQTFLDDGDVYTLDINRCSFKGNRTGPIGGGAVFILGLGHHIGSKATVRNSEFTKNSGGIGGAIYTSSFETKIKGNRFTKNLADAWGGAVAVDNFGAALLFPPLAFAAREVAKIDDCTFISNKTRGVQPISLGFPPPFATTPAILNIFAEIVPLLNNIPTTGTVSQTIASGGGGIAVILAGVAEIKNCKFIHNDAINGFGGGILVGGATGTVTDLETNQTFQTFDYAFAVVKDCKFKDNCPNNTQAVDLDGVGTGPDGVTLIIEK